MKSHTKRKQSFLVDLKILRIFKQLLRNLTKRHKLLRNLISQAAMEFIMTYGGAIIIVLVAVAALAYFGVLSPDIFLPKKCTLPTGISCLDYQVSNLRVVLVLQNNFDETITINKIDVGRSSTPCSDTTSTELKKNEKAIFPILGCSNGGIGARFRGEVNITYTKENLLTHKMSGSILAKITEESVIASPGICQNAEDNGLCSGLNLVFGEGYRDACCDEYGLCCP